MAEQRPSKIWSFLAFAVVGSAVLSIMGSTQVQGSPTACCFANATCEILFQSECVGQGGDSKPSGTNCSIGLCPLLCGASGPECNGECPDDATERATTAFAPPTNTTCVVADHFNNTDGQQGGAATVNEALCVCVPEIPQGGSCEEFPDACAGGLPCVDGVCCATLCGLLQRCDVPGSEGVCTSIAAPAPAVSQTGLIALVAILMAVGGLRVVRRRRLD